MADAQRDRAVLRAAHLYFLDGLTQAATADRLGCTRWTVGRLLKEGEDSGVIDIRIRHPHARVNKLEKGLLSHFPIVAAHVVKTQPTSAATLSLVARTAADYLADLRPRPRSVALGWGRTVAATARALPEGWNPGVVVMRANAAPKDVEELLSKGPARIAAKSGPGRLAWSAHPKGRDGRGRISDGDFDAAAEAEVLVYSPGGIPTSSLLVRGGHVTEAQLRSFWDQGARANILCHIVDGEGENVAETLESDRIAIPLHQIRKMKHVVVVGAGVDKVEPFKAAMQGGLATAVVTDVNTAEGLLQSVEGSQIETPKY